MEEKLTRLTHEIAIQLHLVAESFTICGSRSRRPVRKLLDTTSYLYIVIIIEDMENVPFRLNNILTAFYVDVQSFFLVLYK
jgi:hypothetical protein